LKTYENGTGLTDGLRVEGKVSDSLAAAIGFLGVVEEVVVVEGVQRSDLGAVLHAGERRIAFVLGVEFDERVDRGEDKVCFGTVAATCLVVVH
jgi:hypothetical protein